jgi:alpha-glucosidase (family GH31 glycosyl hydrolase)
MLFRGFLFRYTLFHHAHTNGMPVMRALWMEFPTEEQLFDVDDTFMVGSSLMVRSFTMHVGTSRNFTHSRRNFIQSQRNFT